MADYTSQFTGAQIDARLAQVSTNTSDIESLETNVSSLQTSVSGKQATLVSGTNIKTINGSSILGSGNLEVTAGTEDAVQYVSQTLTEAQKAQARLNIDAASTEDLSALADANYIVAWDGSAAPTVANIPAGVVVTYSSTSYTGTLAASASTAGNIYLVHNGSNYDMYISTYDGSAYSWVGIGDTDLDLSGYATTAELNQLSQKVGEVAVTFTADKSVTLGGNIGATLTLTQNDEAGWNSAIINCQEGDKFTISGTGGSSTRLWGFVDENNALISVSSANLTASGLELTAPAGAAKAVFNTNGAGTASCLSSESNEYGIEDLYEKIGNFNTKINEALFDGSSTGFEPGYIDEYGEPTDASSDTTHARSLFVDKLSGIFWIDTDRTLTDVGAALYKKGTYVGRVENIRKVSTPGVSQGLFRFEIITSLDYDQFRVFASGAGLTNSSLSNTFVIQESFAEHLYGPKVNLDDIGTEELYALYHELVRRYPNYISERVLGYDSSGQYEVYEYVATLRDQFAYIYKEAAYAWINDSDVIYTASISPVLDDVTYSDQFDTETGYTVTAVTSSAITVNGLSYTRDADDDIAADVIYKTTGTYSSVTEDGKTYSRAKNLDRSSFGEKTIMTICNEHGPNYDPREPSFVMYQILRALCEEDGTSPELGWLKKHACMVVIPVVNPYAYNREGTDDAAGRVNYDGVNITRNYPTASWDTITELEPGPYPGSEVETQYVMNSIKRNDIDICINEHCLGGTDNLWEYQGDIVSLVDAETKAMMSVYGLSFYSLGTGDPGNVDVWCREQGITGVILEMNTGKGIAGEYHSSYMLEADREIWLNVLRLYDYFPENGGGSSITVDSALSPSSTNPVQNAVINTALTGKQDTLVSGTDIKTINGVSLLGSGDMVIGGGGTIAVDAALDLSSTNPVQNAVVTAAINAKSDFSGSYNDLTDKPTIPAAQVNSDWDAASGVAQILNKPTIPAAQVQSDWNEADTTSKAYIQNKPTIPAAQIQSDWDQADNTAKDYIKNKPTIPSISGLEATSNKVTALDANSTDTQYPSAKCVYDLVGDIETLINAL